VQQIDETTNWEIDEAVLVIEQAKDKVGQILERAQRKKIDELVQVAKASTELTKKLDELLKAQKVRSMEKQKRKPLELSPKPRKKLKSRLSI
jgi:ATP phosphoribosyltransferase regulatory subunit HisZ